MEIQYVHVKTRSQFGKQCIFDDEGPTVDEHIVPNHDLMSDYIYRNPCHVGVQKSKQFAVHEAQTTSAATKESGMLHTEGGWPKEMNPRDEEATARYRRRVEKDDNWPIKMKTLIEPMEHCVLQNNALNIYENFFDDMVTTELVLPLDVRTVNVYEDMQEVTRPITHLSWSPDHGKRLAVSYCWMEFQSKQGDLNPWSYIWDIDNPNKAFMALKASCPSVTIEFNPRDPSMLISGLMSGQVCNWDIRTGNTPVQISHLQFSHRNPTNLALWINSKSNTEFFSASTGGVIKWWDVRKLREPTESLVMDLDNPARGDVVRAIGVSALQFEPTMGTKFMAGMENGVVVSGTRKGKNAQEKLALRFNCHYGPVVAIDRNPFSTKNFLTVGGWAAKIWAEDTREGNLISSKQHKTPLTGGCWSTSRYSVFYVIDGDGTMEVYDVLVGMKSPVKTIRLCEDGLKAIAPHEEGTLVAVGSDRGKVYLVESSEALTTNSRNDKALMTAYLDRCSRYEKAIDNRLKEVRLVQRISYEQQMDEEPVLPLKGKVKGAGKDARVKDPANDKRVDDKGAKVAPGGIDEKDKKSKVKIKKIKDTLVSSGDPDLDDAEIRYFDVIRKEIEKYAEVAALDEAVEGREAVSVAASSPSTTTEGSTAARRRKREDSKFDKEVAGARRPSDRRPEKERRKSRRSRGEKGGRTDSSSEEIVIVRKSKRDRTDESGEEPKTFRKIDDYTGLERIAEENDEEKALLPAKTKRVTQPTRRDKNEIKTSSGREKTGTRGKRVKLEMEKPCTDYVCQPDVCCVDQKASGARVKQPREKSPSRVAGDPEMEIAIENMLTTLPRSSLPGRLFADELPTSEKSILTEENAPPTFLDDAVRVARREARDRRELIMQGKSTEPIMSRRKGATENVTIDEISDENDYGETAIDSEFIERPTSGVEGFSTDDEPSTAATMNYSTRPDRDVTSSRAKTPRDCEPMALQFTAKDITEIIGVPDAPAPSTRPRLDEAPRRLSKRNDYPRISAAAIPKLKMRDDYVRPSE